MNKPKERIFIVGDSEPTYRVAANTLGAGQETVLLTANTNQALSTIEGIRGSNIHLLTLQADWPDTILCDVAIAITAERMASKRNVIQQLACRLDDDAVIAINTDSILLDELQMGMAQPHRILGLNWSYPADLTLFLEIIANAQSDPASIDRLATMGREVWGKDPYTVHGGFSTRARMMAAWAREAIYLVENGYASMESIDRACRNDAGHYLPFAGNFRYMDLMGTYAYGMVMSDLNPELAKITRIPDDLEEQLIDYASRTGERDTVFRRFSEEIRQLILTYAHETIDH
ncbi:3-hydroxyacyl-CoA dehydrogenase NAD-binding domain-containing protein [Parapedobacter sp.]